MGTTHPHLRNFSFFLFGLIITPFVLLIAAIVWLWRVFGVPVYKWIISTGEDAYGWMDKRAKANAPKRYDENTPQEDEPVPSRIVQQR